MKQKHPVLYLSTAEQDLGALFDYIRKDAPSGAVSFLKKIDDRIGRLSRFPLSGAAPRDRYLRQKRYRVLVVGNYLVFYKLEKGKVFIYRILHGKRRYEFLL